MTSLRINTPRVFAPLLEPARYKASFGGRGSGKSHFYAEMMLDECLATKGTLGVCIREVQKSLKESSKRLLEQKIQDLRIGSSFRVYTDRIGTPGDGQIIFQGMQDHTAETIKSLEGYRIADIEEGQSLSEHSFMLLRPTIRTPGSMIWCRWNPRRKKDTVDEFFRTPGQRIPNSIVVEANWRDNPFWSEELEAERMLDLKKYPERYEHIWEGGYAKAFSGAYYAKVLAEARAQQRIRIVPRDPIARIRAYMDIGGAGAKADAMAIWVVQFVGQQILVLDYIEGVGQVLGYYANELRRKGYGETQGTLVLLPHDGMNKNNITGKRYRDHWEEAGFDVEDIPNQGPGAVTQRIEAGRGVFHRCWFDEGKTGAGLEALGYYHEKRDPERHVGLGPEHDWSSHGSDAFGLMAIHYEPPTTEHKPRNDHTGLGNGPGWMAG
jgi:phage terminase large subunit